jgi:uncharacterized protein with NRDE domain
MCLVVVAFGVHPDYPLIVAGNRDEFHARPTREAQWWPDNADIFGGRDLQAGGTWLALHREGRFATVTNFRDAQQEAAGRKSRGELVTSFLEGELAPLEYLATIDENAYAGFNLFVSNGSELAYMSNRGIAPTVLKSGIYGLSNATLDTPWSKVERSKNLMRKLVEKDAIDETTLLRLLDDRNKGPLDEVETGRLPFDKAHALTSPFIVLPDYGTRSSSIVMCNSSGGWQFAERRFTADGTVSGETRRSFRVQE